jgi:cobyrinic acid a,c-diamide synthase
VCSSDLLLKGLRIGIARDDAFAFLYPANLDLLAELGAQRVFFSPVAGEPLPECDAVWLPGGYPELHLARLAGNTALAAGLRAHHAAGKPIVAECGGMLYLAENLCDVAGTCAPMAGLLPARAVMQPRLAGLGLQQVELPEGTLRGHTFHHSRMETTLTPLARACNPNGGDGEAIYRQGRLTASYMHFYFPSNPEAAARLFLVAQASLPAKV